MSNMFQAMNTSFLTAGIPAEQSAEIETWVRQLEKRLSRFLAASELTRFNNANEEICGVSSIFYQVYSDAMHYYNQTGGLFNPFLGSDIVKLGYDRSFDYLSLPRLGSSYEPRTRQVKERVNTVLENSLDSQAEHHLPRLPQGVLLDLGGFAKGWSAQQAREVICGSLENGFIDAGGDIVAWGSDPEGDLWRIGVGDPLGKADDIAEFSLNGEMGIATSSVIKRSWHDSKGRLRNHIIDPRTGLSADSDLIQATVLAPNLLEAEVFAKCMLILGSEKGPEWLGETRPGLAFMVVDKAGIIKINNQLSHYCIELEANANVSIFR